MSEGNGQSLNNTAMLWIAIIGLILALLALVPDDMRKPWFCWTDGTCSTPTPIHTPISTTPTPFETLTASPIPKMTDTAIPTMTSEPEILFEEDFEDGNTGRFSLWGDGISIFGDGTGNNVWRSLGDEGASLTTSWDNYAFQIRYKIMDWGSYSSPDVVIRARVSHEQECHDYRLGAGRSSLTLMRNTSSSCSNPAIVLGTYPISNTINQWHTLRIEVEDSTIRWQIDDDPIQVTEDDRNTEGGVIIENFNVAEVWFDDIVVWSLDAD